MAGRRPPRRFARDGEVPVTVIHRDHDEIGGGTNTLDAAQAALREQIEAREHAETLLREAQATIRDLQTSWPMSVSTGMRRRSTRRCRAAAAWRNHSVASSGVGGRARPSREGGTGPRPGHCRRREGYGPAKAGEGRRAPEATNTFQAPYPQSGGLTAPPPRARPEGRSPGRCRGGGMVGARLAEEISINHKTI